MVLISGAIFVIVSLIPLTRDKNTGKLIALREIIFNGMPKVIRQAIPVGIGLFIAFIGLRNSSIIVADAGTLIAFVDFSKMFSGTYT